MIQLFDTHTHFDVADFDADRYELAVNAKKVGVEALVLIGFIQSRFSALNRIYQEMLQWEDTPTPFLAPGLHPFYIEEHDVQHLYDLEKLLAKASCVAVGEIGLDTFLAQHKIPEVFAKQQHFFAAQLDIAKQFDKPVLLHIRKAHAQTIQQLKAHRFKQGGIAHAFSGGVEEAKALTKLGFKIGITGQITNPNAKKLRQVVQSIAVEHLVLETDCPDMTPLCCQTSGETKTRNTPVNLPYVLNALAEIVGYSPSDLAKILWQNSLQALHLTFASRNPTA